MKIYYYDGKHNQMLGEMDLGKIDSRTDRLILSIIDWMEREAVIDGRYKCLALANGFKVSYAEGEKYIEFYCDASHHSKEKE